MHQALTAHGLGTIFLTFLHISGQMGWKLMAQNSKAYSVTPRGGGGDNFEVTPTPHAPEGAHGKGGFPSPGRTHIG